jgi:hypothetical protein
MTLSFHKITFTADDVLDIIGDYLDPADYPDSEEATGGLAKAVEIENRFAAEAERLSSLGRTQYDGGV